MPNHEIQENNGYKYITVGSGKGERRVWIKKIDSNEVTFPLKDYKMIITQKGTPVVFPAKGYNIFDVFIESGFRGDSTIEEITPEPETTLKYEEYASPRGALGISEGMLVCTKEKQIKAKWSRNGRLYGSDPEGATVYSIDGSIRNIAAEVETDEEFKEIMDQ